MTNVRVPRRLRPGDRIGVTAPSSGVADPLMPRLEFAVAGLRAKGYDVTLGRCTGVRGPTSAPAPERAAELTEMLCDPTIGAVVPPWGGELAIDLLGLLDWERIAAAEPTWVVGYSDTTTLLLPLTLRCDLPTVHADNLMDTPYRTPIELMSWQAVLSMQAGESFSQRPASHHRRPGFDDWQAEPELVEPTYDVPGRWRRLDGSDAMSVRGTIIGGCVEVVANLAGTPYGDVPEFGRSSPGGLLVYLEAAEAPAFEICRRLHGMRLAGWFERARAVLIGRTSAPDSPDLTQDEAVLDALTPLRIPIIADMDFGHVPPQLTLINGATAELCWSEHEATLTQRLS
jgi:muramoyltetrapeptide carboxypeptidase LdcA involved in peptidoglycan recycling